MPEFPDLAAYREALRARLVGPRAQFVRTEKLAFHLLRTVEPTFDELPGLAVIDVFLLGKRIVFEFERDLFLALHLMISGRLHWDHPPSERRRDVSLILQFTSGRLCLTEAGTKKRATLHLVRGRSALATLDRGGLSVFSAPDDALVAALRAQNRTIKRALTDPSILSGIGNAYSDEILHRARISPYVHTQSLSDAELLEILNICRTVLSEWTARLLQQAGDSFPENVTAFRPEMAVHGKFGQPCPVCGAPVQRVRFADNELNYCAGCQTGRRILADRGLSRLLKDDWPKTLEELEG